MGAITVKTDDASQEVFEKMFLDAKQHNQTLTKGVFFANFIARVDNQENIDLSKYVLLEIHNEVHQNYIKLHNLVTDVISLLEVDKENIVEEIKKIQQRAVMVPDTIEVPEALKENEIRFEIPEPHLSLLQVTKERLSEKLSANITMKDVLLDMFARYTIEMYNEWFYPFVISPDEFKSITGYTQNELKLWLKKTNQQ